MVILCWNENWALTGVLPAVLPATNPAGKEMLAAKKKDDELAMKRNIEVGPCSVQLI